jgi:hypothetical protein
VLQKLDPTRRQRESATHTLEEDNAELLLKSVYLTA